MISEIGVDLGKDSQKDTMVNWYKDAFNTIKSWPSVKAAVIWSSRDIFRDQRFNKLIQDVAQDPYFIFSNVKKKF